MDFCLRGSDGQTRAPMAFFLMFLGEPEAVPFSQAQPRSAERPRACRREGWDCAAIGFTAVPKRP